MSETFAPRAYLGGSAPPLFATVKGEVAAFAATGFAALDGVAARAAHAPPPGAGTRRRAGLAAGGAFSG